MKKVINYYNNEYEVETISLEDLKVGDRVFICKRKTYGWYRDLPFFVPITIKKITPARKKITTTNDEVIETKGEFFYKVEDTHAFSEINAITKRILSVKNKLNKVRTEPFDVIEVFGYDLEKLAEAEKTLDELLSMLKKDE